MAKVHVNVRVQVTGSDLQALRIAGAAEELRDAVEAAGGEWKGGVAVELDVVESPAAPDVPTDSGENDDVS